MPNTWTITWSAYTRSSGWWRSTESRTLASR
jgi:hypothetical protein